MIAAGSRYAHARLNAIISLEALPAPPTQSLQDHPELPQAWP
jgi:hypothetical protein